LLIIEGFILIIADGNSYLYKHENLGHIFKVIIPMLVVFALGLQNAYGRFAARELFAPTTVMTGNVTQLIIDTSNYLRLCQHQREEFEVRISNGMYVVVPFLVGCVGGGLITKCIGLSSVVFAGILIFIASSIRRKQVTKPLGYFN
jgi:uncharacterized membrane protein YoaK (UPF0700 family)